MPIRIGHWLQGIWIGISKMFHRLENDVQKLIPIAIAVVQNVKTIVDGPIADVITHLIPGELDDAIKEKLRQILPVVLLKLQLVASINNIADENEKFQAILKAINLSPDAAKNIFYHGLASLILQELADGKFTWSDATAVAEYYYVHEMDKPSVTV
jgi:hypothetical protein